MIAVAVIIYVALIEKGRISGRERPSYCQRNAVLLIKFWLFNFVETAEGFKENQKNPALRAKKPSFLPSVWRIIHNFATQKRAAESGGALAIV